VQILERRHDVGVVASSPDGGGAAISGIPHIAHAGYKLRRPSVIRSMVRTRVNKTDNDDAAILHRVEVAA
jgi:hypothetical protein